MSEELASWWVQLEGDSLAKAELVLAATPKRAARRWVRSQPLERLVAARVGTTLSVQVWPAGEEGGGHRYQVQVFVDVQEIGGG